MSTEATFQCQSCKSLVNVTGIDSCLGLDNTGGEKTDLPVDDSFIFLDEGAKPGSQAARALGDSFVLLKNSGERPAAQGGESNFDSHLLRLTRLYELASQDTKIDHPLCSECAEELCAELDTQVSEAESEVLAYEDALQRLIAENATPLEPNEFEEEMRQLRETEAAERRRAAELAEELKRARLEAAELEAASEELDALEEQYWHDFNGFKCQLRAHIEDRDALLSKIDRAGQELERLRCTNVYNDAFHIWYDGPFGTISGFRLGRTPAHPVEWTELNAAWGQTVLLLHTMATNCGLQFSSHRLLPMGSHPRITDGRSTYDLFGPPKLWSGNYDKGMVSFLACLQEFADFARNKDIAQCREAPFEMHYPIEGDKVGGVSIKLTFNKDARWTKALKYMLTNLKLCLRWMIEAHGAPQPARPGE
mmetsp:Transcript_24764/g.58940  ORF Transcript_24764/g.58940 Transcript_24764/m.58940 type:complete len:422 (+) Transcript_24764:368-1633(+)